MKELKTVITALIAGDQKRAEKLMKEYITTKSATILAEMQAGENGVKMRKTLIVIEWEKYVILGEYDTVYNRLGDVEECWVDMMGNSDKFSVIEDVDDDVTHTIDEVVSIIELKTTSSQMDGWDPDDE